MKRRKSGLSFALAAVKGRSKAKLIKKKDNARSIKGKRSSSSSESSSESSHHSSSSGSSVSDSSRGDDPSDGSDSSDSNSSTGCGVYRRRESMTSTSSEEDQSHGSDTSSEPSVSDSPRKGQPPESDESDTSIVSSVPDPSREHQSSDTNESHSSTGCGKYRRRESLSQSSSSSSSAPYSDDSESSDASESFSKERPQIEDFDPVVEARHEPKNDASHVQKPPLKRRASLSTLVKAVSSKSIVKRDTLSDIDEGSVASSKVSRRSNTSTKSCESLTPSLYNDEQASMMNRRRSTSGAGRGRGLKRGGSTRESKNEEQATESVKEKKQDVEEAFADLLVKVRSQTEKKEHAEGAFADLLVKARNQKSQKSNEVTSGGEHKTKYAEKPSVSPDINKSRPGMPKKGTDMTLSYRTAQLANANSNLRGSVTGVASKDLASLDLDTEPERNAGSSRFASMMANLKSSTSDANQNVQSKQSISKDDDSESDDEHMFEPPKIVNERGLSNEMSSTSSEDINGKEDGDDHRKGRSRFGVHRPSFREKNNVSKNDKSSRELFVDYCFLSDGL